MTQPRPLRFALLASLPALLAGCDSSLAEYLPTVKFDRLDINAVDWETADTNFVFRIDNPNPIDVTLARFDYNLGLGGVDFINGDDPDGLTLGATGSSELSLPVSVVFQDLYDLVQATRGEDEIPFALDGSFGFNTPLGVVDLPFAEEGGFPALRTPAISFGALRVDDLDWTGATVELDLNVDNEHASNLLFENFEYDVSLAGVDVASGLVADLGAASGAGESTLTLPLEVSFLDSAAAVYEALTSSRVNVGLSAATDVDTPFGIVPLGIDESGNVTVQD